MPGGLLGQDEVRMEDLLGAQYENKERLDMFEGQAAFSLNMLVHQINKSKSHHFGVTTWIIAYGMHRILPFVA